MRNAARVLLTASVLLVAAACGYPDPGTGSGGPVAGTSAVTTAPSSSPGEDNFSDGAGKQTVTLLDGLKYIDLKPGDGNQKVGKGDHISVQYTGWLASNGSKFDSSRDRGSPFELTIGVGQVIPGWDEGLLGMAPGAKRKLIIPAALGYGTQGQGTAIPANSDLVFDVELISDTPAPPSPSPTATPAPSPTPT